MRRTKLVKAMRISVLGALVLFMLLAIMVDGAQSQENMPDGVRPPALSTGSNHEVQASSLSPNHAHIAISPMQKGLGIALSIIFLAVVFFSIRKQHLSLDYAFPWMAIGIVMGVLAVFFEPLIMPIADAFGIAIPMLLLLLIGMIFLLLLTFYTSMRLSLHEQRIKNLMQEAGISKLELGQLRDGLSVRKTREPGEQG